MIYIVGVRHEIQHNGTGCDSVSLRNKFSIFLKDKIQEYDIDLLAEEFNEDALSGSDATVSTVKKIADDLNMKHKFCEASKIKREQEGMLTTDEIYNKKLGIKSYKGLCPILDEKQQKIFNNEKENSFSKREKFLFEQIIDCIQENIIFVCGADHVERFKLLLLKNGHQSEILTNLWQV